LTNVPFAFAPRMRARNCSALTVMSPDLAGAVSSAAVALLAKVALLAALALGNAALA
jgi:hypothetical protein